MSMLLGPAFVLVFTLSQAFRDVYFGDIFQRYAFFLIILIAFVLSTVIFAAATLIRVPADVGKLRGQWRTLVAANITTALAWTCFFFALTYLDPAIVNTIHSAMGPLTVVLLGAGNVALAKPKPIGRVECAGYAGIAASVAVLWYIVIGGYSDLPTMNLGVAVAALALLGVSGSSITVSLLYCKRLQDQGIGADAVTAARYIALIALAGGAIFWRGRTALPPLRDLAGLSVATTALIVLPLFAFQLGIGRTTPLTAQVIRALGPVFVFGLEQFDHRIHYSLPALMCILAYSASVIVSNVAHGWSDERKREPAASSASPPGDQPARLR